MRLPHRLSALIAVTAIFAFAADLEDKIRRVETGLVRSVVIKGRPAARMTIAERLKNYNVPGVSIAVVANGEIEWARGFGQPTTAPGAKPVNEATLFQAASISKPVAAMVALRLVELGKLALDEDVNLKLKSWRVAQNPTVQERVTLRRLLSHTAGMSVHGFRGYAAGEPVPTLRQILDGVKPANSAAVKPDLIPGRIMRYSGGGYEVVHQLIEDVTGQPFSHVARELVLDRLGMKHSTYEQPLPERYAAIAAIGHRGDGAAIKGRWHTYPEQAAAGLWTTPSDLARVILEIQKPGKALKPETAKLMVTKVRGDYGLGLGMDATGGMISFSHGGSNAGYRCVLFGYLNSGGGAVVMTNGDLGGRLASEILRAISAEYGWPDHKPQEKALAAVDPKVLESYAGTYQFPNGPLVVVTFEEGKLYAQPPSGGRFELLAESATSFFDIDGATPPLRFTAKPDGSMELTAGNATAQRK